MVIDARVRVSDIDSMPAQARRRARAKFITELPRLVPAFDRADTSFDGLVEHLSPNPTTRERVCEGLLMIARDYRFSRDLNLARVSRPDVAETLQVISLSARSVVANLDRLNTDARKALELHVPGIGDLDWEPGIQAIDTLAELLDGVSEAAFDLTQGILQLRASDAEHTLVPLLNATRTTARQLSCFPDAAKWWLVVIQQSAKLGPSPGNCCDNVALLGEACANLGWLAASASKVAKADRGPRSSIAQMLAVYRLKALYETVTGQKATTSQKTGRRYTGVLESEFGRFAEAAFHLMEADRYLRRGLAEAVSYAVWGCRAAAAEKKAARARDGFERRMLCALAAASVTNNSPPPQ